MIIYWGVADSLAGEGDRVPLMDSLWRTRHLNYYTVRKSPEQSAEKCNIKKFHPQRSGLRRGWEGAEHLLFQLAAFVLVINVFLLPPCFVHRVHNKPPVFREGTLVPSFVYTKVPFLLSSYS